MEGLKSIFYLTDDEKLLLITFITLNVGQLVLKVLPYLQHVDYKMDVTMDKTNTGQIGIYTNNSPDTLKVYYHLFNNAFSQEAIWMRDYSIKDPDGEW
jgi:hypothetical protein